MDYDLAAPVAEALHGLVERSDTGYAWPGRVATAFAGFADTHWGLAVDPSRLLVLGDVLGGVQAALEVLTRPGDAVVVETPAYPPFWWAVEQIGRRVVEVPYAHDGTRWQPDTAGIADALAAGARAIVLCSPHNPTGTVHGRDHLEVIADVAERHGAAVLSDEVHGFLTYGGGGDAGGLRPFVPFGSVALERPALTAVTVTAASKAWNFAGLKCAQVLAHTAPTWERLREVPEEYAFRASLPGVVATEAAYEAGGAWLDATVSRLARARDHLGALLAERLPAVRWTPPDATYLAWLDCRGLGLDADPAAVFLEHGRVALAEGPLFGPPGAGFARLNFATGPAVLSEAVDRMVAAVAATPA